MSFYFNLCAYNVYIIIRNIICGYDVRIMHNNISRFIFLTIAIRYWYMKWY